MIASVRGVLEAKGSDSVVVNVGGVGLQVFVPTSTLAVLGNIGEEVRLHTHLYFKEDVLALYGFVAEEELRIFRMLLNVAGMGPRTSLSALSVTSPTDLVGAIASEDLTSLTRIPGVGRKTAARIVLELKGALEKDWIVAPQAITGPIDPDAVAALAALGYAPSEARSALVSVPDIASLPLEEKIRQALQRMGQ